MTTATQPDTFLRVCNRRVLDATMVPMHVPTVQHRSLAPKTYLCAVKASGAMTQLTRSIKPASVGSERAFKTRTIAKCLAGTILELGIRVCVGVCERIWLRLLAKLESEEL